MSDYTKTTDFSAKDALASGDPEKLAVGADVDAEYDAIAVAVASKENKSAKGQANGYCGLDGAGRVDRSDMPAGNSYYDTAETRGAGQGMAKVTLTDGATISVDASLSNYFQVTLGGNRTLNAPTNLRDGQALVFRIIQDVTGARTLTWNSIFRWPNGTPPTLSSGASDIDIFTGIYDADADQIDMSTFGLNFG